MRVLILAPYPPTIAPSQRFRFEQYLSFLDQAGIEYHYVPFINLRTWSILHKPGHFIQKGLGILHAFGKRLRLLRHLGAYDWVFIHREASHIGPPVFEWLIAKWFRKKIIYDFDDAIWLPNYSEHNRFFHRLKFYGKVRSIMRWSHKVSAGNAYLCDFAREYNDNVTLTPTTIDTEHYHNQVKDQETEKVVIGWTGTLTTAQYLKALVSVLQKLEARYNFEFQVISNEVPDLEVKSLKFIPWKKETEISDLLAFNIGVMPLVEDPWAKGKCGFKALQYMSLGIPAVASPVGVNSQIVDSGVSGYLCTSPEEWYESLALLISDVQKRKEMGKAARLKIEQHYSVKSNEQNFLRLFEA